MARDRLHKTRAEECFKIFLVQCIFHCFMMCISCPPALHDVFCTFMARYSLLNCAVSAIKHQLTN